MDILQIFFRLEGVDMRTKLKKDEARVIRINQDAIFELIYETFVEKSEQYFDLLDSTKVKLAFDWDQDKNEFTCVAHTRDLQYQVDFESIAKEVGITTDSMFQSHRYKTIEL